MAPIMQCLAPIRPYVNAQKRRPYSDHIFLGPWVSFTFISLNSYQRKRMTEIASTPKVQRDPYRALSGRMGLEAVSSSYIPEDCHPSAGLDSVLDGPSAAGQVGAEAVGSVRGRGRARLRRGLHRPYRLAHRTPVLYSRNQSRTNIVPCKEKREEGRGKLAELLIVILKTSRGTWIVRGRYWGASRTPSPTSSRSFWS